MFAGAASSAARKKVELIEILDSDDDSSHESGDDCSHVSSNDSSHCGDDSSYSGEDSGHVSDEDDSGEDTCPCAQCTVHSSNDSRDKAEAYIVTENNIDNIWIAINKQEKIQDKNAQKNAELKKKVNALESKLTKKGI
ncbi:hypothetical protein C2845_PM11G17880 [Panicum miliaceum]|uniref:Uncharacterized protein n=1 Tax=Panicum miliaceum TaxID=4540 RepID=A0A3L6RPD8_PANMI|nr:hypothetical protein C2845_PM11G17880 [Panicum miliaceum]